MHRIPARCHLNGTASMLKASNLSRAAEAGHLGCVMGANQFLELSRNQVWNRVGHVPYIVNF
jgi:hypothetical protein